jgi:serine protease Do
VANLDQPKSLDGWVSVNELTGQQNQSDLNSRNLERSNQSPISNGPNVPRASGPGSVADLVSKVFWLVALFIFGLALLKIGPILLENYQYAATRGRIRAEYENAVEMLEKQPLANVSKAYQLVAQRIRPSVVSVTASRSGRSTRGFREPDEGGQGSGVVMSSDGYIITNHHVVKDAEIIVVDLADRRRLPARLIGTDDLTDLAVLKIDVDGLIPAEWGDSEALEVGSMVWAVGSPYGLEQTVTQGILSGKHRGDDSPHQDFLQTDAAVNPGNSGGPLVDAMGKVIGINTSIFGQRFQGISFAVPSSVAQRVFSALKQNRLVNRGFLGVTPTYVYQQIQEQYQLPNMDGAYVEVVDDQTPAARAGIQPGDIIVKWNGLEIKNHFRLYREVAFTEPNSTAEVDILREGIKQTLYVQVGDRSNLDLRSR